jgi:pimeloyl-ACP methyl ester carboxylesterase
MVNVLIVKNYLFILVSLFFSATIIAQPFYKGLERVNSFDKIEYPYSVSKQAIFDGMEIAYMDEGSGSQTILFIHGLGSYAPAWKKNIEELKSSYRCIAIDLPGYGRSSKGEYDGSMSFFSKSVISFMDSLGLDDVVLAGHSMGGQIAMVTSLSHPDRVSKLVLVAPAGIETFSEGEKEWFRDAISAKGVMLTTLEAIESNLGQNFYKMPDDAFFMVEDRYAMTGAGEEYLWYCYIIPKSIQGMVNQPVIRDLPKISQPTLILMGAADQLIPNRYLHGGTSAKIAEQGGELIPNSRVEVIKKAGHFVMFEKADEVNALLMNFMN